MFACGDKPLVNPWHSSTFSVGSFPMNLGREWKYLRVDRLTGTEKRDTIMMKVVSDSVDTLGNQYFWLTFTHNNQQMIDSQFVQYTPDSLVFLTKEGQLFNKFQMPLKDSLEWKGWVNTDKYSVGHFHTTVTSYGITHDSSVSVSRNFLVAANHQITQSIYFKPNKGLVQMYFYEFWGTIKQKDETWVLMEN